MRGWTGRFDDPSYTSPFAQELFSGYMRFQSIDDGSMWSMLNSEAEGVGLHVGQLLEPECCTGWHGSSSYQTVYKNRNNPWLFPSIVTWKSVMNGNFPHIDFVNAFDIDYPVVAISHVRTPVDEFRWALNNINYEIDTDRVSYMPDEEKLLIANSAIIGVVPLWTVLPLTSQERTIALQESIRRLENETDLKFLSECWCTIDAIGCEEECARDADWRAKCTCNSYEKYEQRLLDLYQEPINIEHYMNDITLQTWQVAVNRFYDGWQVIANTNEQGEQWASYWQQAQSPFLVLPGQNFRDLQALTA